MFKLPAPPEHFVGRREQIAWIERLVFAHEHWFRPHFVVGPAGIGKSALVSYFLAMLGSRLDPVWIDAAKSADDLSEAFDKQIRREERSRRTGERIVVIDQADALDRKSLDRMVGMVLNYKLVRALIVTTRKKPSLEKGPVLTLAGLTPDEAGNLFKMMARVSVSATIREQILMRANGNPLLLKLLIGAINTVGIEGLTSALNIPLYDIEEEGDAGVIAVATPQLIIVESGLIDALRKEPDSIYKLTSRKFEELLAELLESQGMTVELTPRSKDGGRDILAYSECHLGKHLYLVEAKRYAKTHKVGVELVRQLYGVLCDNLATAAMLVTTSSFTKGAKDFHQKHLYELSLKDCSDLVKWIGDYKKPRTTLVLGK